METKKSLVNTDMKFTGYGFLQHEPETRTIGLAPFSGSNREKSLRGKNPRKKGLCQIKKRKNSTNLLSET